MTDTVSDRALREAVTFLLSYMPLSDLAVYEPDYLAANAAAALRAQGVNCRGVSNDPADIFLNFVLPPRVNNENPDDFRISCYAELKDRVNGLAMEAALEVNSWCHEKVAYQAADSRTSAPLATMLSARGDAGRNPPSPYQHYGQWVSLPARSTPPLGPYR
jgi:hypothetical protein